MTYPTAYNSAPVCAANDTSAIATVRVQATATALTLSQSRGTDTIAYICVGNPNSYGSKRLVVTPHRGPMHIPESAHFWALFVAGHGLHVLKRASLPAQSVLSDSKTRTEWLRTNAINLTIRFFINAAAFSYWLAHPDAATHAIGSLGIAANFTLDPGHATAAMFGPSGDSLADWAAAKIPFLQKEIPLLKSNSRLRLPVRRLERSRERVYARLN